MKATCLTLFCAILASTAASQKATRSVSFIEAVRENLPFFREHMSIPEIVFDGASENRVTLYLFDDFNKNPKILSYQNFKSRVIDPFPEWKSSEEYYTLQKVQYKGVNYQCLKDGTMNEAPDIAKEAWKITAPRYIPAAYFSVVGLDYLLKSGENPQLQFLHFYLPDRKESRYVASIRADEAIKILNESKFLWYKKDPYVMNHLIGDVFLFNWYDREKLLYDLRSNTDTSKIDKRLLNSELDYSSLHFFTKYKEYKPRQFFVSNSTGAGNQQVLLDSIDLAHVRFSEGSNLKEEKPAQKFMLLGDALLNVSNLNYSDDYKKASYKMLKMQPVTVNSKPTPVHRIACRVTERFMINDGFHRFYYDKKTYENLNRLLERIYQGVSESNLKIYNTLELDSICTMASVIQKWMLPQETIPFPEWEASGDYFTEDLVSWKGKAYRCVSDNSNMQPDISKKHWKLFKSTVSILQPSDINFITVRYDLIFDESGSIISKKPYALELGISGFQTVTGFDQSMGSLSYADLVTILKNENNASALHVQKLIEDQVGLFEMLEYNPLQSADHD